MVFVFIDVFEYDVVCNAFLIDVVVAVRVFVVLCDSFVVVCKRP